MDFLKTLCVELDLSHQQLARLMQTDRSNISKSISGHRSLPLPVATQLAVCYKAWKQVPDREEPTGIPEKESIQLEARLAECRYQLQVLQRKMKVHQYQRAALQKRCRFLEKFKESTEISASQKDWAEILHKEALHKLAQYPFFKLQHMRIQEVLLMKEIEMLEELSVL